MERERAGMGLPSSSSFVRTTRGGSARGAGTTRGKGRTAFDADGGEAEVALVGEEAVPGVAPCGGEDEVDHGEGGGGDEGPGDDISRRTLGDPTNIPAKPENRIPHLLLRFPII